MSEEELCVKCEKRPFFYKKWRLCQSCYSKYHKSGKLYTLEQFKFEFQHQNKKVSDDCIDGMINDGFTVAKIAQTCGISRQAVHQRINKEDYKQRLMYKKHYEVIFLYKIGFLPNEIEDMVYCKVGTVHRILNQYNIKRPFSPINSRYCRWAYNVS